MRQLKREVKIGNVTIGGKNPIAVQTMLNVPVEDIEGNVAQAKRCEAAGCQILRVTCPSAADAKCIEAVKNAVNIPIVADIHFDYKAAIACADVGERHARQRAQTAVLLVLPGPCLPAVWGVLPGVSPDCIKRRKMLWRIFLRLMMTQIFAHC